MNKKIVKIGTASLLAAGAGMAVIAKNKKDKEKQAIKKQEAKEQRAKELAAYRNTERGKNEKNSKGIYYENK